MKQGPVLPEEFTMVAEHDGRRTEASVLRTSRDGIVEHVSRETLAKGIEAAIKSKRGKKYGRAAELVLAVDAIRFPGHATREVIETFRASYPSLARSAGFREVWVVGLLREIVWRLDT